MKPWLQWRDLQVRDGKLMMGRPLMRLVWNNSKPVRQPEDVEGFARHPQQIGRRWKRKV